MIILIISIILVLMFIRSWINMLNNKRRINLKGPMPVPILGNAHQFVVKSTEFLNLVSRISLEYGDAFLVHFLSDPFVFLNHPKYIEPLVSSSELLTKGLSYNFLERWLGQGLLTAAGQRWKIHRKLLTPAFHFNILHNFLPVFCKNQDILTKKLLTLADGKPIDLFPIVALTALDNVTESIMGVSVNAQEHSESEYVQSTELLTSIMAMRIQIPILANDAIFNLLPYKAKQEKALKILHDQTKSVIEARRAELNKANITSLDGNSDIGIKNKHAFLDLLLLSEVDGKRIDDESVREEVDTFMFEGHDTTTSGIVYSLFCLSKHRTVQEKIYEEQERILADDFTRNPTYNELKDMKYLDMVIRECMRLYPPVPMIQRQMTKDCEVGELKLIKGTAVTVNIFQSQRHPDVFEDPLEFRPERHEKQLKNPFSWLAFSAGPRNCIGQKFAMMELKVSLPAIVRNFTLLPCDIEPQPCADIILRSKNGVHIRLLPRN